MLFDNINFIQGSGFTGITIPSGDVFPDSTSPINIFYLNADKSLYILADGSWEKVSFAKYNTKDIICSFGENTYSAECRWYPMIHEVLLRTDGVFFSESSGPVLSVFSIFKNNDCVGSVKFEPNSQHGKFFGDAEVLFKKGDVCSVKAPSQKLIHDGAVFAFEGIVIHR